MQMLDLAVGWAIGLGVCAVLVRWITLRFELPWQAALMYFGLAAYPDDSEPDEPAPRRRTRRAASRGRRAAPRRRGAHAR